MHSLLGPSLLLVGHDPGFAYLIDRYAVRSGYTFFRSDGSGVQAAVERVQPTVIVLDLPEPLSGEVLRLLKTDGAMRRVPVLMCSNTVDREHHQGVSASSWVSKPVLYADFVAALAAIGVPV